MTYVAANIGRVGDDTPAVNEHAGARRLIKRSAIAVPVSYAAFLGATATLPATAEVAAALLTVAWLAVVAAAVVGVAVGAVRLRRDATAGPVSDAVADLRYREAIAEQRRDMWRQHRDGVLAVEAERRRARDYLALPEGDRYESWIRWQLAEDPGAETLPYPPPAYPPPPPRALPA